MHLISRFLVGLVVLVGSLSSKPVTVDLRHLKLDVPLASLTNTPVSGWKREIYEALPNTPIYGNILPYGIFWLKIGLGTPTKKLNVAIDTGSSDTIVSLDGCKGCHITSDSSYYYPAKSSTNTNTTCDGFCMCKDHHCYFSNTYQTCDLKNPTAPCTIKGPLFKDVFELGGIKGDKKLLFGGINFQTDNFEQFQHIHGVMGLSGYNFEGKPTPVNLLADEGKIPSKAFAMCFNDQGGKFTLGGADPALYHGSFNYTPIAFSSHLNPGQPELFALQCTDFLVNGGSIHISDHAVIVDSGTNNLLLPADVYNPLYDYFNNKYCKKLPHVCKSETHNLFTGGCFTMTPQQRASFPPLSMVFNGATLVLQADDYILKKSKPPYGDAGVEYCLGIGNTGESFFIIGDTTMTNYYALFDVPNRRIGWAPVNAKNCF